jgi:hypothetical protein
MDKRIISEKKKKLDEISSKLKNHFIGLDDIIDKIIHNIELWYIFPDIIKTPVIINLWGLTGVGQTDLIRKLVKYLDFSDKYVEIVMDDYSEDLTIEHSSVQESLINSSIVEDGEGILLLDEFQKFRTISSDEIENGAGFFNDVWELFSDGKFSNNFDKKKIAKECLMEMLYSQERQTKEENDDEMFLDEDVIPDSKKSKFKYKTSYWNANRMKKNLRLSESVEVIMTWDREKIIEKYDEYVKYIDINRGASYKKLLIFVCGNLDEAYEIASDVDDADTDADIFYKLSKNINIVEIKTALKERFKPEQISRLGNIHIIYPSLSKDSYKKLIEKRFNLFKEDIFKYAKLKIEFSENFKEVVYRNSVFPTQGVRPVFSTVDSISNIVPNYILSSDKICNNVIVDYRDGNIVFLNKKNVVLYEIEYKFDIDCIIRKYDKNLKTLLAVHETGHAIVYTVLNKIVPKQIKSALSSYEGGYIIHDRESGSRESLYNSIIILMAGRCAEEYVFGYDRMSSGSYCDIKEATSIASNIVRKYAMDFFKGVIMSETDKSSSEKLTNIEESNERIHLLLDSMKKQSKLILEKHRGLLIECSEYLTKHREIIPDVFKDMFEKHVDYKVDISKSDVIYDDYCNMFENFKKSIK